MVISNTTLHLPKSALESQERITTDIPEAIAGCKASASRAAHAIISIIAEISISMGGTTLENSLSTNMLYHDSCPMSTPFK